MDNLPELAEAVLAAKDQRIAELEAELGAERRRVLNIRDECDEAEMEIVRLREGIARAYKFGNERDDASMYHEIAALVTSGPSQSANPHG